VIEKLETILNAWEQLAPDATFSSVMRAGFRAQVERSRAARAVLDGLADQLTAAVATRDTTDATGLKLSQRVVNGVVGHEDFGPDSPLYEALGCVRRRQRKSGLTRKSNKPQP
jgi:hypothetical protein